jgi:hypothetical protein
MLVGLSIVWSIISVNSGPGATGNAGTAANRTVYCPRLPLGREGSRNSRNVPILVEYVDGESVLFSDTFMVRQRCAEDEHDVAIAVNMCQPPNYYISIISDRCYMLRPACQFRSST